MEITKPGRAIARPDVVVHVDESLDEQNRRRIEHAMINESGIEHARFNSERQHLLIVSYDPAQTTSSKILKHVRKHRLSAQLIGGI